ncbi:sulfite exporter TauE/SafE family protein [Brevibacillus marinus]|uniref:sulfite exporter TauE/SafE family protein n=1 Tax=Brevibacillus marinus TaxID=2496837 RepID=UPI000F82C394|nr:sulfite exporter TauE/SafE family protein [Brevibacillus marinus]
MTITPTEAMMAAAALLLAGLAKGISGMGLPVVAIPILAVLFDLQTAIAVTLVSTLATDVLMLVRLPKSWSVVSHALLLAIFGVCGIVIGSLILLSLNQLILSAILGVVILAFVVTSCCSILPAVKRRRWLDAAVGLIGGVLQGAAGASGPVIGMYLLQLQVTRTAFLFLSNSFFVVMDLAQFVTIFQLGLYKGSLLFYALLALIPSLSAFAAGMRLQRHISDRLFRRSVLLVMALSGLVLLGKSLAFVFSR